jgi:hypothetical protein
MNLVLTQIQKVETEIGNFILSRGVCQRNRVVFFCVCKC